MKRNELLAKSLTLGLAVATAATSMSVPGGLLAPQTVYAEDGGEEPAESGEDTTDTRIVLSEENIAQYIELGSPIISVNTKTEKAAGPVKHYVKGWDDAKYGNTVTTLHKANSEEENKAPVEIGKSYDVYVNVDGKGTELAAAEQPIKIGTATVYEDWEAKDYYLQCKDGEGGEPVIMGEDYYAFDKETNDFKNQLINDAVILAPDGMKISTSIDGDYTSKIIVSRKDFLGGSKLTGIYAKIDSQSQIYAKNVNVYFKLLEDEEERISGTVKLDGTAIVGQTLTASVAGGNSESGYKYMFIREKDGKEEVAQESGQSDSYTLTKDDVGYTIKVIVTATADKIVGELVSNATDEVVKKECDVSLGEASSLFGEVTGTGETKAIAIKVPDAAKDAVLEYSLDEGKTWADLIGDSITLGNKSYTANTIQVRVKETADTKAGEAVKYADEIKATLEGSVAIIGDMRYGETITAEVTGVQEDAKLTYKYIRTPAGDSQTGSVIEGATEASYKLGKDDIGCTISVLVSSDNYAGTLTDAVKDVVAKADARVVAPIEIESKKQVGETYTYALKALEGEDAQYAVKKADAEGDPDWKDTNTFDNLEPNTKYVFYATYKTNDCYEDSTAQTQEVTTDKLKHAALSLTVDVKNKDNAEGTKTVTITSVDGAEYSFDGGKSYGDENTKDFVVADTTEPITVAIRYKADDKYEDVAPLTQTFDLSKEMQDAPSAATLQVEVNADKTAYEVKVTAPSVSDGETLEYSTDGVTYGELSAIKTIGLAANTSFTLYVRKAATVDKNASAGVAATATTPAASAAPTITGEAKFKDKTSVAITGTGDIYYTTDGNAPTTASTKYTSAIEVSATTTIKAIAVEDGKIMSAVSSETFTKESSSSGGGSTSGGSSSGGGSATTPSKDDTKKDDTSKTETKPDGTKVTTTETKAEDGSVQTKIELKNDTTGVDATVNVAKDAQGKVTGATADVTQKASDNKTTISAATVAQITEAAGTKDVEITTKTVDANGKTVREVTVNASDLTAGKKLKVVMVDPKTGEKTLVNKTTYKVAADGSLALNNLDDGNYEVVTTTEWNALTKEVLKTVKPEKTKKNVTVGKKTKFALDDALNMDNVAKITYKTGKKSVATVNANGTITAKKAGKVTIKAVVTLNNGKKKTIKMTITVKKKK